MLSKLFLTTSFVWRLWQKFSVERSARTESCFTEKQQHQCCCWGHFPGYCCRHWGHQSPGWHPRRSWSKNCQFQSWCWLDLKKQSETIEECFRLLTERSVLMILPRLFFHLWPSWCCPWARRTFHEESWATPFSCEGAWHLSPSELFWQSTAVSRPAPTLAAATPVSALRFYSENFLILFLLAREIC